MADIFRIVSSVIPKSTHVVGFRGTERLSYTYRFAIGLLIKGQSVDMSKALHQRASLFVETGDGAPMVFHGLIARLELLHCFGSQELYRATLVPKLWLSSQNHHSRVFVQKAVPDMITELLEANGLDDDDFELRLHDNYEPCEFVCQYQESDFSFLSRWLEREGMYFFFEHGMEREKLIITDHSECHSSLRKMSVRFVPVVEGDAMAEQSVVSWICRHSAVPKKIVVQDYDYLKPRLAVVGEAELEAGYGQLARYGENVRTPEGAERLATLHAEQLLARQQMYEGHGRVFGLRPGYTLTLVEHPRADFNIEYLCTELHHVGNQSAEHPRVRQLLGIDQEEEYRIAVEAIAADVQYRPADALPWPRIEGFVAGQVCGPKGGDYAEIDEYGRYLVRFLFDESGLPDGQASAWVRMMQPYAGGAEGFHFPLLKGTEVMVSFVGGDPDRPVIAGTVPNVATPSPVTGGNATENVIRTAGGNVLQLDDTRGSQFVSVSCPVENSALRMGLLTDGAHVSLRTDGYSAFNTGLDHKTEVGGSRTVHSGGDQTIETPESLTLKAGSAELVMKSGFISLKNGAGAHVVLTGDVVQVYGDRKLELYGKGEVAVASAGSAKVSGTTIALGKA